jgi:hypothetical protein
VAHAAQERAFFNGDRDRARVVTHLDLEAAQSRRGDKGDLLLHDERAGADEEV